MFKEVVLLLEHKALVVATKKPRENNMHKQLIEQKILQSTSYFDLFLKNRTKIILFGFSVICARYASILPIRSVS